MSQQQAQRSRSNTHFSFRSDKSNDLHTTKSKQSKHERKLSENEKNKIHYDPSTKANPNAAMEEAQPIAAALERPTLQNLRSFQHTDAHGNAIAEPDLSNPTRSRWERPLDTIRSFEAAIDGEYKRRVQSMRVDQTDVMSGHNSRRSSYYGGGHDQNRYSRASYYGHHPTQRDSYDNANNNTGGPVGGPPRGIRYSHRMQSDPGYHNRQSGHNVYPIHGLQQSRDTVNTNGSNGSHSDGPYSNDPSSDNSSFERAGPVQRPHQYMPPDMGDQYGQGPSNGNGYFSPPPPPPKHATPPAPIKLNATTASEITKEARPTVLSKNNNNDEKRRSWFKRRFSKD